MNMVLARILIISIILGISQPVFAFNNPLTHIKFAIDTNSAAAAQIQSWGDAYPTQRAQLQRIAQQPIGHWFGDWNTRVRADVHALTTLTQKHNTTPVLVLYNIPNRDCGSYSAGGAQSVDAYKDFVRRFAKGIGDASVIVIVEPDALGVLSCLSTKQKQERFELLAYAVKKLKKQPHAVVYIDAGHFNWIKAKTMSKRLTKSGIDNADGFALNVSNFYTTADNTLYGENISARLTHKHFVIDTSRNGAGPSTPYEWCNPSGMKLGTAPTVETGNALIDAFLWIKPPGESDGTCTGGPSAGTWWLEYALDLSA